ncbi:protein sequence is in conflict with the conceptual translation [Streptomyces sp. NL15-2K]|nr:protein sequence is in conflict with the conceptual translation [Streptomyces sp. NL15-2K]
MSDEQKHQDPHEFERQWADSQVSAINMANHAANAFEGFFGGGNLRVFGKTDFERHALNHMIDMVESANPEDLETASTALWNAQTAIEEAADELEGHITRVDWEGESGEAFRKWGAKLVTHARHLAAFAEISGTQINAAATGLASVRSSMPPRDTRFFPKEVEEIPTPQRVEGNKEYAEAVKAEQDRQEAINQMNRLASFYAVSEETLAGLEPPTFEAMPDVGVPKPDPSYGQEFPVGEEQGTGGLAAARESVSARHDSSSTATGERRTGDVTPPLRHVDGPTVHPDVNVGTKIDSVGTLPPQETTRPTTSVSPVTAQSGPNGGPVPPVNSGPVPPVFRGPTSRAPGLGGATGSKSPIQAQGRTATPSGPASGRSTTGPMGRATSTGPSGIRGGPTVADRSPTGRGVSGGTARPIGGGQASDRAGGASSTGAARGNGVVGGRPAAGSQGATGSRVPRGTVVGAEGNTGSRTPAGQIGQRGVIGAPNSTPGTRPGQTARPPAGNPDGVVGTPKGRTPPARSGGPAGGGGDAPHGRTANRRNTNREAREGESQPETPQRNAPPVTD